MYANKNIQAFLMVTWIYTISKDLNPSQTSLVYNQQGVSPLQGYWGANIAISCM